MALKEARQALATAIDTAITDTTVDVLAFDPPDLTPPIVTVATAGITPTEWRFTVRIYMDFGQPEQAQDALDDLAEALIVQLEDAAVPRTSWDFEFDEARGQFIMAATVDSPREDF